MNDDLLIEKLWTALEERQESINKQLSESERKFILRQEEGRRLIELSEQKFFQRINRKNTEIKDIDQKILKHLEENRPRIDGETWTNGKKTNKQKSRRSKYELCDIIIEVNFSAEQKQKKDVFISQIYRLKAVLQEAGYKITGQEDNIIKISSE
ncbi:MAG: hypothetical protein FWB73_08230 [Treponema sp.]|nr:hypothetical protein [Treponema sp.]